MKIASILASDERGGGVKQVGHFEVSNWIYFYYSIDLNEEKIRGIIKIEKLSTEDISKLYIDSDNEVIERLGNKNG